MSFYNNKERAIDKATMMGMWANQSGPWVENKTDRAIDKATMMGMWANQAGNGTKPAPRLKPDVVKKWCARWISANSPYNQLVAETLISNFASTYGTSKDTAMMWFKKNCRRPNNNGTNNTPIVWADWCKKYLYYLSIGDNNSISMLFNDFGQMTGQTNMATIAQIFKRECGNGHSTDTTTTDDTVSETADDCRITCYKCVNGNNVANRFDPIKSSKANGRGYNYDCPTGWTVKGDPCKTPIRDVNGSNGSNNTVLPIRDVDTISGGSYSGSNTSTSAVPNRGLDSGTSGPYLVPFSGRSKNMFFDGGI